MKVRALIAPLCAAAALGPAAAGAAETRLDHRDSHGPLAAVLLAYDSVSVPGRTVERLRPAVRAGWGVDVAGQGNELIGGADVAFAGWSAPGRDRVLAAAHLRYRSYFGTEEWKTFLDLGAFAPLRARLAVGPLVGLGAVFDFDPEWGLFAGVEFDSAFGQARVISVALAGGLQFRFDLP